MSGTNAKEAISLLWRGHAEMTLKVPSVFYMEGRVRDESPVMSLVYRRKGIRQHINPSFPKQIPRMDLFYESAPFIPVQPLTIRQDFRSKCVRCDADSCPVGWGHITALQASKGHRFSTPVSTSRVPRVRSAS